MVRSFYALTLLMMSRLFWFWAGPLAFEAFCTPTHRHHRRDARFDEATAFMLSDGVRGWKWGEGPAVFLVHGWAGSSSQLLGWVHPLVERGFSVIAIDQRAHGHSRGWSTNAMKMASVLRELAARVGQPVAVVAHSLGGVITNYAMVDGLSPRAAVLIASPRAPESFFRRMLAFARFAKRDHDDVVHGAEEVLGRPFSDFIVGPGLRSTPTLLIHDTNDTDVPIDDQRSIADGLENGYVMETEGLGHHRILSDPHVIATGTAFVCEVLGDPSAYANATTPPTSDWSEPLITEEELWLDLAYGR